MRWLRRGLVAVVLAAPVLVVAAVAWPEGGAGGGSDACAADDAPELSAGDEDDGSLGPGGVVPYRLAGSGEVRVGVRGQGIDATVTVVRPSCERVAFNDDTHGLDPEVTIDLGDDGDDLVVEVRELGGNPGAYTVYVDGSEP